MARSSYIYVATKNGKITGLYTVKAEMSSAVKNKKIDFDKLFRFKDGQPSYEPIDITGEFSL